MQAASEVLLALLILFSGTVYASRIAIAQARPAGPEVVLEELSVEGASTPRGLVPAYAGGQVAQGGRLGLLGNVEARKAPFSIASHTDTLIRDRQARTVNEALVLDPSVRATQSTGAPFDSFAVRGFPANENTSGEVAFDGLYGIAPSFRIVADYAEHIEVLKGPSAALTGVSPNGAVGGVVNVVPKRAGADLTRVTLDGGSAAHGGGQLDTARRWGAQREWGARVVGSLQGGATLFDHQAETTGVGALALDYQGEKFRAWLYLLAQTDRFDAPLRPFLLKAGVPVPRPPARRLNLTQPWEYSDLDDRGGLLRTEYDLTDQLTLFADVGGARSTVDCYFQSAPTLARNSGEILAPAVARQVEAGVKLDLGRFGATLGAFRITKPSGELGPQNRFAATGEQRVSGLELSLFGAITPQVRVLGGVTLLDGVLTKTALAANLGHRPIGVPEVQASLGAEWDLPGLPGLTLDGAVIYTGRQFVDLANRQALPDWARLDLGLRYATVIGGRPTTFRATMLNVTGTNSWTGVAAFGTFFQGAPRTYLLSMAVDL